MLKPAATRAGIAEINYHMFRRGHATEAHQLGSADKNIQAQLRHADPNVTRKIYMQAVPAAQREAVNAFERHATPAPAAATPAPVGHAAGS